MKKNNYHLNHYRAMNDDRLINEYLEQQEHLEKKLSSNSPLEKQDAINHFNAVNDVIQERGLDVNQVLEDRIQLNTEIQKRWVKNTRKDKGKRMIIIGFVTLFLGIGLSYLSQGRSVFIGLIVIGAISLIAGLANRV